MKVFLLGLLSIVMIGVGGINAQTVDSVLTEDNGILKVEVDLTRGGAIGYISLSGSSQNVVNIHDNGRYIQQSYYAGNRVNRIADGQNPSWSPFPWNPVQAGDSYGYRSKVLAYGKSGDTLYTKCIPMHWDMDDMPAHAVMEQWTVLDSNVLEVHCKLTVQKIDSIYGENIADLQELPAVYLISSLDNLYTYLGTSPFTNDSLNNPPTVNLSSGGWGRYGNVSEHWMAFVNQNKWGVALFNQGCTTFSAGIAGTPGGDATSPSTVYMSANNTVTLNSGSVYQYSYDIIVGTLYQIRHFVYEVGHADTSAPTTEWNFNTGLDGWYLAHSLSDTVADSAVTLRITGVDPYMVSPENLNVNASKYRYLSFTMKNNTNGNTAGFFWSTNLDALMSPSMSFPAIPVVPNDSAYTTYVVDLSTDSTWAGLINQIRLDPVQAGSSGTIDIRQIKLLQNITSVKQADSETPARFALSQNYPNPFNPTTRIEYSTRENAILSLKVYDVLGQEVATLFSGIRTPGNYVATFNAGKLASGVYFYRLREGDKAIIRKLLLLK